MVLRIKQTPTQGRWNTSGWDALVRCQHAASICLVKSSCVSKMKAMTRSVLIFGTDHKYQRRDPLVRESQHEEFAAYVMRLVSKYGVKLLAEEYTTQALKEQGVSETTVKTLANSLEIAHCYCDLDRKTRYRLRIFQEHDIRMEGFLKGRTEQEIVERIGQSHRTRERFWLERLREMELWPVLFICGADHASHFANLLRSKRLDVSIVEADWSAS